MFFKWYFLDNFSFWYKFSTRLFVLIYDALGIDVILGNFFAPYRKDRSAVGYGMGVTIRFFWLVGSAVILAVLALLVIATFLAYYLLPGVLLLSLVFNFEFLILQSDRDILSTLGVWAVGSTLLYWYSRRDYVDKAKLNREINLRLEKSVRVNAAYNQADYEQVKKWVLAKERRKSMWKFWQDSNFRRHHAVDVGWLAGFLPEVKTFSRDLTRDYVEGKLPYVYGREEQLAEIVRILNQSINNNVLLVGEAGVGKRALVYALIEREQTKGRRVIELNLVKLLAKAGSREELAQRLDEALRELRRGRIILFLPEVHILVNAGLADYLSPTLGSEKFPVVATTTPAAYRNILLAQKSFLASFNLRQVQEPSYSETLTILLGVAESLEGLHQVCFTYPALKSALELSERYLHNQAQPEKAIAVLDAAATRVKRSRKGKRKVLVTAKLVRKVVEAQTGVPVTKPNQAEVNKLLNLEKLLHRRVVGQDLAIKALAKAMRRARAGISSPRRPLAALLFVGPTGVGKTLTAKVLAHTYFSPPDQASSFGRFGADKYMVRFDMSEFAESGAVANFVDRLAQALQQHPYVLVLLDEFEKAEPEIHNLFLQVMENGKFTDQQGRIVDFRSTIIIATSNALSQDLASVGAVQRTVLSQDELEKYFRPELLNRFDGIIKFYPLTQKQMVKVARRELEDLKNRLAARKIKLSWSDELVQELAKLGYDAKYGARPLRRLIQDRLEDRLATKLLRQELLAGDAYCLTVADLV